MAGVVLEADLSEISRLQQNLARFMGQFEWITARAMTTAAKASRDAIRREILPKVKGGATRWTERGLIVQFAKPDTLRAQAGFQYGEGRWEDSAFTPKAGGIPAGRYMGVNASGGDRRPKASEMQLRRSGLIDRNQFIVPYSSFRGLDPQGNVSGGEYKRMLSQLQAFSDAGSNQNTRPQAGRDERGRFRRKGAGLGGYFMASGDGSGISRWQLSAQPLYIAERTGAGPKGGTGRGSGKRGRPQTVGYKRGFAPAFSVVDDAPNYERKFPIQSVAMREYQRVFPQAWRAGFEREAARRR
jgi:hypothetical protein